MTTPQRLPGLERVMAQLRVITSDAVVLVGIQGADVAQEGPGGTPPLVLVAAANEFGTDRIPPRPFLRTSADEYGPSWAGLAKRAIRRDGTTVALDIGTVRILGAVAVGDVQEMIRTGPWTPNAPKTIRRKGSDQPLIDTGRLVQSVRSVLVDETGTTHLA